MWWDIQLADRRGLLTGRGLSRVQTRAIELLLLDEDGVFSRGRDVLRMAGSSASPSGRAATDLSDRVPDLDPDAVVDTLDETNADDEGEGVTYLMPEDFSGADAMEVLAQMGRGGTVSAEDFDG